MREIKFRVYTKDTWMDGTNGTDMLYDYQDTTYVESFGFKDIPLMQFTGLKDKYGKFIYENDICKTEDGICKIVFQDGGFVYLITENETFCPAYNWHIEELEVIGNIYENPEILNN